MTTTTPLTFAALLARRLREQPGSPLVTFYDDATGERTELSATSYDNWVAKHANLFREELDLDDGATVLVDLPAHWLVPVVAGGAWTTGLAVTTDATLPHDVVVTDVPGAHRHAGGEAPVLACSLHPFALPTTEPLPAGVLDHGHLWPGQSDVHVAPFPPDGHEVAWRGPHDVEATMASLLEDAAGAETRGGRVLVLEHPLAGRGTRGLLAPLLDGSVVYVTRADESLLNDRVVQEGVTIRA